jgi:hypothetical protein
VPWFRLDDSFHSHPKVIAAGNEAIGLYVRCGTYAAQHLTDGFIPEDVALLYGSAGLADALVSAKLWRRARGGWRMPDYLDYNPSKEAVEKERKAAAERQRRRRSNSPVTSGSVFRTDPVEKPVEKTVGGRDPTSGDVLSRRDSRRDTAVSHTTPSRPGFELNVVNRTNGSSPRASPAVIDSIMKEVHARTGRSITPDWAQRVADNILKGDVANPAAYVRQAIRNEPNPRQRFLPLY